MSWQFLYHTQMAECGDVLLFRFLSEGQTAYLVPVGEGDWENPLSMLIEEAEAAGEPFLLKGVCENSLKRLQTLRPDFFIAETDRNLSDYIYLRTHLATLAGKNLQPKRNLANRFEKNYPDYEYLPLSPDLVDECKQLHKTWLERRERDELSEAFAMEEKSMTYVLNNLEALQTEGGVLRVDGKVVAFTYGRPINYDTYGVCFEKADTSYEGAFATINREFAKRIPERYLYVNREEDLGLEGLRQAKLAYRPEVILQKYSVRIKNA